MQVVHLRLGVVVPFSCKTCGYRFIAANACDVDKDGRFFSDCPECGSGCYADKNSKRNLDDILEKIAVKGD